jgi:sulfite exporter TauE/SafE
MLQLVSSALVMGLSASTFCLAACVPVLFPYTGTVAKPSFLSGVLLAFLFSAGRLLAYAVLLMAFILLKTFVGFSGIVIGIGLLISSVLMILSSLVSFGVFKRPLPLDRILCRYVAGAKSPLYLGIMSGIRPCGPLLAAIAFVLTLPGIVQMGVFMLSFWLASSAILLIIGGVGGGMMAVLGKRSGIDRIRRISAMAMMVVGIVLLLQAVGYFSAL